MNKTILVGRLTRDPELKQTSSGLSMLNFTLAVNKPYKDSNGQKQADFINCVAWRQTADVIAKYCAKGSLVLVEGSLINSSYEKNGQKHYQTLVNIETIEFLGSKPEKEQIPNPQSEPVYQYTTPGIGQSSPFVSQYMGNHQPEGMTPFDFQPQQTVQKSQTEDDFNKDLFVYDPPF